MIIEDMARLMDELCKKNKTKYVARQFGKERKWVYSVKNGCSFVIDAKVVAGLREFGYDIKLVRIGRDKEISAENKKDG